MNSGKAKEIRKFLLKPEPEFLLFMRQFFGSKKTQSMSGTSLYRTTKRMYKNQFLNKWFNKKKKGI